MGILGSELSEVFPKLSEAMAEDNSILVAASRSEKGSKWIFRGDNRGCFHCLSHIIHNNWCKYSAMGRCSRLKGAHTGTGLTSKFWTVLENGSHDGNSEGNWDNTRNHVNSLGQLLENIVIMWGTTLDATESKCLR